jgi:DNA-binding transcriptional MerR regulator
MTVREQGYPCYAGSSRILNVEGIRAATLVVRHMDNHDLIGSTSMSDNGTMSAGDVRKATGASRAQLRYWESNKIVCPVMEQHNHRTWRRYPADEATKIGRIIRLLGMGFTLKGAIKNLPAMEARERHLTGNAVAGETAAAIPARAPEAATPQDSDSTNR